MSAPERPPRRDLARLRGELAPPPPAAAGGDGSPPGRGRRWQSVGQVLTGAGEALAELRLPPEATGDLDEHPWHPALLDVATSFALPYLAPGPLVPVSYERLVLWRRLPAAIYSHAVRRNGGGLPAGEAARFEVSILDAQGEELAAAAGVTFQRWDRAGATAAGETAEATAAGILPHEGVEVFRRLLLRPDLTQVAVAVGDLGARLRRADAVAGAAASAAIPAGAAASAAARHPRPPLATAYAPPRSEAERVLAAIWGELLGFDAVGIHDNFFDLGGDSVVGLQLLARAAQAGLQLSAGQVFQFQTIAELAAASALPPAAPGAPVPAAAGAAGQEDFPAAELSREGLAKILAQFGGSD